MKKSSYRNFDTYTKSKDAFILSKELKNYQVSDIISQKPPKEKLNITRVPAKKGNKNN